MPSWLTGLFGRGTQSDVAAEQGPTGIGVSLPGPVPSAKFIAAGVGASSNHQLSVIGGDDRQEVHSATQKPWCAICYLECMFGTDTYIGTGWMIDATTIITAAHNLWNPPAVPGEPKRAAGKVDLIRVSPARLDASGGPFETKKTNHFVYDRRWEELRDPVRRYYDYGVIYLDKPGYTLPFYFAPWALPPEKWDRSMRLNCAGYPIDLGGHFVTASGSACSEQPAGPLFIGPNQEMVIHNMDTEGGESGGPIFWTDGNRYFALAVHTQGVGLARGMNAGVRITPKMIDVFNRWRANPNRQGPQTVE
jgi:V8-like Glu-specific endopeptidase